MVTNRFRQAFKNAFIPFILFAGVFGVSAFISCSSTPDNELPPPGGNEAKQYCVYVEEQMCFKGPYTDCPGGGSPADKCPYEGSSSVGGGVSSSSLAVVPSSSSAGGGVGNCVSPVSCYGELKASGNRLIGSKTGTALQVRGVSLFWSNKGWGGDRFFNATTVNAMVDDWKAEIIRVPIGYSEGGGYKTDASNLTRVKAAINAAIAKDVYVIIDWHSHNAHNELSAATTFFTEMAQTYGSNDHVIFEIYNEPLGIPWTTIKSYATSVISAIRQHSDNLILVGTPNWDQDVNVVAATGASISDANVAYVFHFYARSHSLSSFQSKINSVLNAGFPVFVSEYGTTHADGGCNPADAYSDCKNGNQYNSHDPSSADAWHTFMDNNKISSCAWSVNDKYEGSAFFGTGSSFDMSSWTNTSKMTASGQYIFNKLRTYANSAPWRGGSN
jgi:endoglucanase